MLGEGKVILKQYKEASLSMHLQTLNLRRIATSWVSTIEHELLKGSGCKITNISHAIKHDQMFNPFKLHHMCLSDGQLSPLTFIKVDATVVLHLINDMCFKLFFYSYFWLFVFSFCFISSSSLHHKVGSLFRCYVSLLG